MEREVCERKSYAIYKPNPNKNNHGRTKLRNTFRKKRNDENKKEMSKENENSLCGSRKFCKVVRKKKICILSY